MYMGLRSPIPAPPTSWALTMSWSSATSSALSLLAYVSLASLQPHCGPHGMLLHWHSWQHSYLLHPCIFSHNSPQTTSSRSNTKYDLSGLLHTIRQTPQYPYNGFHFRFVIAHHRGALTRSLILLFVLGLFPLSESNLQARTVRTVQSYIPIPEENVLRAGPCPEFSYPEIHLQNAELWEDQSHS